MKDEDVMALHIRNFPTKLTKRLRRLALETDTSLRAVVIASCEEFLKTQRQKKKSVGHG